MNRRSLLLAALLLVGGAAAYTVKPGDTLYSISRANGTTPEALMKLNNLGSTTLEVGQELRLPGQAAAPARPAPARPAQTPPAATSKPGLPAPLPPEQLTPTAPTARIAGVNVTVPASLRMGEAFTVQLSGARAAQATVRFPSEIGEDVRQPNEILKPVGAAGEYSVPGRVVLGKTTPVVFEVSVGGELVRGRIPVVGLDQPIQHLNLPPQISGVLVDPGRKAEDALVEKAYARRTPQVWTRPFAPALSGVSPTSSSFGQPRTYTAGGPVAYHFGTDYPARAGTPVLAVNDGMVVIAGRYPVRGGLVVIDHGAGVTSLYFHQSRVTTKVGQKVTRGQKIGEVGSTGLSAGPHLHLEIRVRGEGTNPGGWMNRLWPR
ncbi:peptidoglycan DD-metalloendopeptidase family protein [Deinococcus aquaticus]|uniref:Peptidoglycan DD-metalloendopeptidase family protein n=1 Tax=Deinococcus aquaticus TaxID=328692 RepID=A0ABY7UYM6_9DEIO|nr:peptidoglycan DD-metalloendopeptidase family protein [Deinococcus aquaticus]WDA57955.1 peptidoglycan DD-metalloendopeptidase family protein [Deinococcus aquaticus]